MKSFQSSHRFQIKPYLGVGLILASALILVLIIYLAGYNRGMMHERAVWLAVPQNPFGPHP